MRDRTQSVDAVREPTGPATVRVIVVDDDVLARAAVAEALRGRGYEVAQAGSRPAVGELLRSGAYDLAVVSCSVEGCAQDIRDRAPDMPIVALTTRDRIGDLHKSLRAGAVAALCRSPLDLAELGNACDRALSAQAARDNKELASARRRHLARREMIGGSLDEVRRLIARFGPRAAPVLILGETGTGKELVARELHEASGRRGPYAAVNCGAVPEHLIESELFGHVRGAFTGAVCAREGLLEYARGGTLLLDEVNSLPHVMQSKLLRFLADHEVRRVGGNSTVLVDVRILAASNEDLAALVQRRQFRADLYHRLNVLTIELPPLRARGPDEIELLARHALATRCAALDVPAPTIRADALEALRRYDWPGNVRELESAIERALALAEGEIGLEHLPATLRRPSRPRR